MSAADHIAKCIDYTHDYLDGDDEAKAEAVAFLRDAEAALSILRKCFAERTGCVLMEHGAFLFDTSWVDGTPEELALLERLMVEPGSQYAPLPEDR